MDFWAVDVASGSGSDGRKGVVVMVDPFAGPGTIRRNQRDRHDTDTQSEVQRVKRSGVEPSRRMRDAASIHARRRLEAFRREKFITSSPKMLEIFKLIEKVARIPDVTVLIEGETGSGKELIAEAIHYGSCRADGPFVTVNSGAIPSGLVESELFGYEAGSFTGGLRQGKKGKFELAAGGTLLLDEISELPLEAQTKLLRSKGPVRREGDCGIQ
jgi:transcriptional regulator with PAS, ATPase and Fis domain